MSIIMHIDVNNAFLSWTAVYLLKSGFKEDIRYSESVIGGDEKARKGIVLAKSMVAKARGVKTAETLRDAKRKCNDLKVYPPNYKWYKYMSNRLFALIRSYTPDIEILSIDECFIDYGKVKKLYGDEVKFAYKLKKEIKDKLGFTVNIGVANNRLCAKMASDFLKPDRVHTLYSYEIKTKMYPLPIGELYGIGKKITAKLKEININTIEDLASADEVFLSKYFKNQAKKMIESARGISDEVFMIKRRDTNISNSTTLSYNLNSIEEINKVILPLVENVTYSLRKKKKYAYVIGVSLKDKFFKTRSHQKKLLNATNDTEEIYNICKTLVKELYNDDSIRLVGVSLSNLVDNNNKQISIFDNEIKSENNEKLDEVVDKLKEIYGANIITKASLINNNIHKKD